LKAFTGGVSTNQTIVAVLFSTFTKRNAAVLSQTSNVEVFLSVVAAPQRFGRQNQF